MSWPTPQDYNEAIQNPRVNLADPELQAGVPELTPLGLPRPITGNFASVYRMRCPGRDWAVRCFWREFADQQERYRAISHHLGAAQLPYTVGFDYLPRGIRVAGEWYPILKMEWVEGILLSDYVQAHLHQPSALQDLARQWLTMATALEGAAIAHGDLQHGNVLVIGRSLKLVDYDGMFVPALAGRSSHELGHQNYQHPRRTERDFGPGLDRFSAWVVYLSLVALSHEPALWDGMNGGDECLLLRRDDFERAGTSPALSQLAQHRDPDVRALAQRFRALLAQSARQFPPLAGQLPGGDAGSGTAWRPVVRIARRVWPGWNRVPSAASLYGGWSGEEDESRPLPPWLHPGPDPASFSASMAVPRACTAVLAAASVLSVVAGSMLGAPSALRTAGLAPLALCAALAAIVVSYRRDPAVIAMRRVRRREQKHQSSLASIQHRVRHHERARERIDADVEQISTQSERSASETEARFRRKRESVQSTFQQSLDLLAADQRAIDRWEQEALAEMLLLSQAHHLLVHFRRRSIWRAPPEVGGIVKLRLWLKGVRTAGDINSDQAATLKQFDPHRIKRLIAWRVSLETGAKRTIPKSLQPETRAHLQAPCVARRSRLEQARQMVKVRETDVLRRLDESARREQTRIDRTTAEALIEHQSRRQTLDAAITAICQDEPFHHRECGEARRELSPYEGITFRAYLLAAFCPWWHGYGDARAHLPFTSRDKPHRSTSQPD